VAYREKSREQILFLLLFSFLLLFFYMRGGERERLERELGREVTCFSL
jgi:hypothetical protein